MREDLVSVIIPVYNVKLYLKECIDSVVNQTYQFLDIVLVDDGSTDGSGEICDGYAKLDQRIKVIHKKNGGLSDARNCGMKYAAGEYFYFVDSDDYLELDAIEYCIKEAKEKNADIVECNAWKNYDGRKSKKQMFPSVKLIGEGKKILETLIRNEKYRVTAWNKLYKKSLFDTIEFPFGCLHEDIYITHLLFLYSNIVVVSNEKKYYYRIRKNSITSNNNLERLMEHWKAREKRKRDLIKVIPELEEFLSSQNVPAAVKIVIKKIMSKDINTDITEQKKYLELYSTLYCKYSKSRKKKMFVYCVNFYINRLNDCFGLVKENFFLNNKENFDE